MDCESTNHIIPDKSMFKALSMLEGDKSAMFITKAYGTQQRVHVVGEVCLPPYPHDKTLYMFNLQRPLYETNFNFYLILISLLVRQGKTLIF